MYPTHATTDTRTRPRGGQPAPRGHGSESQLVEGLERVSGAFRDAANISFQFPGDVVKGIADPIVILDELSSMIPAPWDVAYAQALHLGQQLAEFAFLVPMIDKAKAIEDCTLDATDLWADAELGPVLQELQG